MEHLDTSRWIIDTDVVIDYLPQYASTLEIAISQYDCSITAISLYELRVAT